MLRRKKAVSVELLLLLLLLFISALKFELCGIIRYVNIFDAPRRPLLIPSAGIECRAKTLTIDPL